MPYLHFVKFLIMELNFTPLHNNSAQITNCFAFSKTVITWKEQDLKNQWLKTYCINLNEPMQLSLFALSTHKHEVPKNLNETQHKGKRTLQRTTPTPGVSNTWPTHGPRALCAAGPAFWECLNNYYLNYLVYSSVFESVRPVSEQAPFERT